MFIANKIDKRPGAWPWPMPLVMMFQFLSKHIITFPWLYQHLCVASQKILLTDIHGNYYNIPQLSVHQLFDPVFFLKH